MKKTLHLSFLLAAILLLGDAKPQQLVDTTFGNNGVVATPSTAYTWPMPARVNALVQQPDGKILAAGTSHSPIMIDHLMMARYHPDGSIDTGFGGYLPDGTFDSSKKGTSYHGDAASSIALYPSGKFVLGQASRQQTAMWGITVAARYMPDGKIDSSFGDAGFASVLPTVLNFPYWVTVSKVFALPGEKVLSVLNTYHSTTGVISYAILRLTNTGQLDSSFAVNGRVLFNGRPNWYCLTSFLQNDGKLLTAYGRGLDSFEIRRYLPDGSIDASFGNNGVKLIAPAGMLKAYGFENSFHLATDAAGNILFCGVAGIHPSTVQVYNVAVTRLSASGITDNSFGNNGWVKIDFGLSGFATTIHPLPDGRILLTGVGYPANLPGMRMVMARLLADGSADFNFGKKGVFWLNKLEDTYSNASIIQPDGMVVLGGSDSSWSPPNSMILVRVDMNKAYFYNELAASIFLDKNGDGVMNGSDYPLWFPRLKTYQQGGDTIYAQSSDGNFLLDVDTGTYVSAPVISLPYYNIVPASHTSTFSSYFSKDTASFGLVPIPHIYDVAVSIFPVSALRSGVQCSYKLKVANIGTDTATGVTVRVLKDYRLLYSQASILPVSVMGDTLVFNIGELYPLADTTIVIRFAVATPPVANINDTLIVRATVSPLTGDFYQANNHAKSLGIVAGSYDPNDKAEAHAGKLFMDQYEAGEYLEYIIRFQNTGNDTAFNVYLIDELNTNLDLNTFELTASSHPNKVQIKGRSIVFTFNEVMLPDSNVNEMMSHGFVSYRIKPKAGLAAGTVFTNKADIFFDYNDPVTTNTEITQLMAQVLPVKVIAFEAKREGETNLLKWTTSSEVNTARFEVERSSSGVEFIRIGTVAAGVFKYSFIDDHPLTGRNFYRLRMVDNDGKRSYSPVRVVEVSKEMQVKLYPNPATGKVTLQVESLKATTATVKLINVSGVVVKNWEMRLERGVNQSDLSLEGMASGVYFMKINVDGAIEFKRLVVK